ncbi:MAG: family 16 glycosylhydrolase [Gammaproteobacteria bacterium]|jgi:beta-glucanase (GH16 family)|nr:family 16 glycosylhydrolase [Gammaproteobacteria bacterium]MDH3887769.1 family 16 glycosylhydrolase [Gammaproteobacteria bacterium]MDH3971006.1 family 16 glycosylhydrolase [Gammaproteobacteria bacterium]MDH3986478.1 family 16 glycosylhydrolase [Gammaproteobacteria bacterium]
MKFTTLIITLLAGLSTGTAAFSKEAGSWKVDFLDNFDTFNQDNWQDQLLWVNNEDQCYVADNEFGTRETSNGTIKLKVVSLDEPRSCDNEDKFGKKHPDTRYVAGRIASKNRQEFIKGKWTARLKVSGSGQDGMFPAWWLLGALNNEPPVQEPDETVCWPMTGSGEIDIFEHHSDGGPDHYASRMIVSKGHCGGGDWESMMGVMDAKLDEYHEYSVEWQKNDLVYRRNGAEVYRNAGMGDQFPEPLFAILNFAKINDKPMEGEWVMEVDWVKHESWQE